MTHPGTHDGTQSVGGSSPSGRTFCEGNQHVFPHTLTWQSCGVRDDGAPPFVLLETGRRPHHYSTTYASGQSDERSLQRAVQDETIGGCEPQASDRLLIGDESP